MRRITAASISLVILLLVPCFGCQANWRSEQRELLGRLKQLEKEEGWRILVNKEGVQYLDIETASLTPVYLAPRDTMDGSYVGTGSFNPSGTKITFAQNWGHERALIVFDLIERRNEAVLTMPYMNGARWSPDGNEIAFGGRLGHRGNYSLYLYRLSDKKLSLVVENDLPPGGSLLSWGPDGKTIVYADSEGNTCIDHLETGKRNRLGRGLAPTWSPNGRYVAYLAEGEADPGYIIHDLKTGKKDSLLVGKGAVGSLIWSPDSRYLVHTRASRGFGDHVAAFYGETHFGDLFVIDLESKVEVKVYSHSGTVFPTDWAKTKALK